MKLRLLSSCDIYELLQFEVKNRLWFESHIEKRDPDFYSIKGVSAHVQEYISYCESARMYAGVVEEGGKIIGRVNLRNLDSKGAEGMLGYRVSQQESGKGVASFGVENILNISREQLMLRSIRAKVSVHNTASQRVLEKFGFKDIGIHLNSINVGARRLDTIEYLLKLA
ncbi:GNAT family N-acetyltransferase [Motiliproteus sp. MSK22-1]|uniref:GNAT family N-acetyltransferase n=1 Tax=Motiliproteus sp. MSK22-1 TaxID=1897630 RepID=UPI000975D632|nr:GNAT family protein [Motiliproteus sp. MSK22-1]OMH31672.1 hypothetical protein BGP75_16230 [Motiliproteus sp. MSK22-1]